MNISKDRKSVKLQSRHLGFAFILLILGVAPLFAQKRVSPVPQPGSADDVNARIARLALATPAKQGDYIVGSGDLLSVQVFDVPELSRDVRVNETGFISLPLLRAKIHAAGLTPIQLQDKLAELLQSNGLVSTPEVSVSLKEQRSQPITVIGAVRTPLVIQAMRQTTLLQVLSQAGGISEDAGSVVIITRNPTVPPPGESNETESATAGVPETFTIGLGDLLETGDARFNVPILGGDVISVPKAGIIYVVGAVTRPGGFVMQNDRDRMTTLKVMSLAGGTTRSAKVKSAVILRKNLDTGKRDELPVDLNKVMHLKSEDVTLQASDILFVPDSSSRRALNRAGDIAISLTTGIALVGATRF